jgi:hypothetical protein
MVSGPSTSTISVGLATFGNVEAGGAKKVATATQCLTDLFSVTNPNGASPPVICGINTGEHMYVQASDSCNELSFQLGVDSVSTTIPDPRQWLIKVSLVLMYRKLSLSIIDNFAIFGVIELSVFVAKIIDNSR